MYEIPSDECAHDEGVYPDDSTGNLTCDKCGEVFVPLAAARPVEGEHDERYAMLRAAALQAIDDFRNFASHIDDVGGSGGDTLRASARALERALAGVRE